MINDYLLAPKSTINQTKYDILRHIKDEFERHVTYNNKRFYTNPEQRDLEYLFSLYDDHYFSGYLGKDQKIYLKYSNKLTRSAGSVKYSKRKSEAKISVSLPLIFGTYFCNPKSFLVNGITCKNPTEALMRVLEHEITHLVEFIMYGISNCNKPQFLKIAYDLFGHTKNKHELGQITNHDKLDIRFKKGDMVTFPFQGKNITGKIINIRKNITVEVSNPYQTKKFYVPISMISKF